METQEQILAFVNETLLNNRKTVGANDSLLTTNVIDSLGVMRLVAHLETAFDIRISPADVTIENFRTIAHIAAYVDKQRIAI